jgi:hypothetical protein
MLLKELQESIIYTELKRSETGPNWPGYTVGPCFAFRQAGDPWRPAVHFSNLLRMVLCLVLHTAVGRKIIYNAQLFEITTYCRRKEVLNN